MELKAHNGTLEEITIALIINRPVIIINNKNINNGMNLYHPVNETKDEQDLAQDPHIHPIQITTGPDHVHIALLILCTRKLLL